MSPSPADRLRGRVRAPEIPAALEWLNTTGPLSLSALRGRWLILDFWTFCCLNCLHVLEELRSLEADHSDVVSVLGIHSPKFEHEKDPAAVRAAIERYEVEHPVVNDPGLHLWRQYAVKAWPTLALVDPEGYVVLQAAGEGQASALAATIAELSPHYLERGTLHPGPAPDLLTSTPATALRFPAKAIVLPAARTGRDADTLLVADTGHHQLVELTADGTELRRIGSGTRGRSDGPAGSAGFAEPSGLALLPDDAAVDYDVVVADTVNHVLRGVRLSDGAVVATIDLPRALEHTRTVTGPVPAVLSPWDVAWWPATGRLVVAAAGVHLLLSVDPGSGRAEVLAGTTVEGLKDGPAADAWLAQPSGLAVDGERVWFVDAETSALRWIDTANQVHTAVGEGLFDFGLVDGPAERARLQHPLGVSVAGGDVLVADTYNGAIRRWDGATLTTVGTGLLEPSGLVTIGDELVVVESAAHRLVPIAPGPDDGGDDGGARSGGAALRTERPASEVGGGPVRLQVMFTPAPGRKLDERYGPSTQLTVTASPASALTEGAGSGTALERELVLVADCVLHVTAQAASCDNDPAVEHPACYLARQDWGVPVHLVEGGPGELTLPLLG